MLASGSVRDWQSARSFEISRYSGITAKDAGSWERRNYCRRYRSRCVEETRIKESQIGRSQGSRDYHQADIAFSSDFARRTQHAAAPEHAKRAGKGVARQVKGDYSPDWRRQTVESQAGSVGGFG